MIKYFPLLFLMSITIGCATAKFSGTGVNVEDEAHFVQVQANSFNAEVDVNADHP